MLEIPFIRRPDELMWTGRIEKTAGSSPLYQLYNYWRAKSRDGRIPSRADILPEEIAHLLPYVMLHDVVRQNGAYRFKVRLIGTHIVDVCGSNPKGRYIDEYRHPDDYKKIYEALSSVVATRAARYDVVPVYRTEGYILDFEVMTMPLSYDGEEIDMLFCGRRAIYPRRGTDICDASFR